MRAQSDGLGAVRQNVFDPEADGLGESQVHEFGDQSAGDHSTVLMTELKSMKSILT